jgi:poly-gamma-glutamate synthesis protein (capsule biosynthesis protein)
VQIALTGDVMLGRLVDQYVIRNQSIGPDKIWSDVLPLLLKADRRLINLECVISGGVSGSPIPKPFIFAPSLARSIFFVPPRLTA